jgi:hypothetical protein
MISSDFDSQILEKQEGVSVEGALSKAMTMDSENTLYYVMSLV